MHQIPVHLSWRCILLLHYHVHNVLKSIQEEIQGFYFSCISQIDCYQRFRHVTLLMMNWIFLLIKTLFLLRIEGTLATTPNVLYQLLKTALRTKRTKALTPILRRILTTSLTKMTKWWTVCLHWSPLLAPERSASVDLRIVSNLLHSPVLFLTPLI